jgi:hypothetical protein
MKKFLIVILLISVNSYAKKFTNTYIEFEMPDYWACQPEGGQHVCQHINPEQKKEAIIVMASKYKGPEDSLKDYMNKLEEKRTVKDLKGKDFSSVKQYTKNKSILGSIWVDSQHESREVPNFVTRYLATVTPDVGIVITFSAHKEKFKNYTPDFYKMAESLRVRKNIPAPPSDVLSTGPSLGSDKIVLGSLDTDKDVKKVKEGKGFDIQEAKKKNYAIYFIILAVLLVGAYIYMKKRSK